jgi:phytoene/squalene synthetase
MHEAMDKLMARAQAEGRMRQGVTSRDVKVLFAGTAQMLRADGNRDPAEWRRYAELVANALRA